MLLFIILTCRGKIICHNLKGLKQAVDEIVNSGFCYSKQPESEMLQMVRRRMSIILAKELHLTLLFGNRIARWNKTQTYHSVHILSCFFCSRMCVSVFSHANEPSRKDEQWAVIQMKGTRSSNNWQTLYQAPQTDHQNWISYYSTSNSIPKSQTYKVRVLCFEQAQNYELRKQPEE